MATQKHGRKITVEVNSLFVLATLLGGWLQPAQTTASQDITRRSTSASISRYASAKISHHGYRIRESKPVVLHVFTMCDIKPASYRPGLCCVLCGRCSVCLRTPPESKSHHQPHFNFSSRSLSFFLPLRAFKICFHNARVDREPATY